MGSGPGVQVGEGRGAIRIENLREFQRSLRVAGAALPRELKKAFDQIGREILLPEIKWRMEENFSQDLRNLDRRTGKLEKSLRAVSQQREGRILEGKSNTPQAGWWEFGGSTKSPRGGGNREFIHEGRTLYPALKAKREEIAEATEDALTRISLLI